MATAAEIQQLYIAYFGRPADPDGLASWLRFTGSLSQVAQTFATTSEFTTANAGLTVSQQVNAIYRNLFGRDAEVAGLNAWTNEINAGRISLAQAGLVISQGAQGTDATALDSKKTAASNYTTQVNTSTSGILSYSGQTGISAGRSFLVPVTTTATIPTSAATTASVNTLISNSGSGGGVTFNQIAQNAVLTTTSNVNGNGTGAGFTPSANFLTNANDIINLGVFSGAIIQDSTSTDNDVLNLNAAGFATYAQAIAGIETIQLNGAASFSANNIGGVNTINFVNASRFNAASAVGSAAINVFNSGVNGLSAAANQFGVVTIGFSAVANGGSFGLGGGSTALTLSFNSAISNFTFSQNAAGGLAQNLAIRGAGSALTFNLDGGQVYTRGGSISAGGNILVNNTSFGNGVFGTTANIFSFSTAGINTYQENVGNAAIAANQSFAGISGLNVINFATTAGAAGGAFAGINLSANFTNGALSLGFGTGVTAGNALTGLFIAGDITVSAMSATTTGSSDTLTLSFLSDSATSGLVFSAGAIIASAVENFSLNLYGSGGNFTLENSFSALAARSLAVNTTAVGFISFNGSANLAGNTGFRTFSLSQADGGFTFTLTSAFNSAAATAYTFVAGSGNDTITLRNIITSAGLTQIFGGGTLSGLISNINSIDISDGGNDIISLGFGTGLAQASGFVTAVSAGNVFRASIVGFGVGDVLSFTQNSTAGGGLYVGTLTGNSLSQTTLGTTGLVGLFYDGTDTLVFFAGSAGVSGVAGYSQLALAAVLRGGDYSSSTRWTMSNQGALQLTA